MEAGERPVLGLYDLEPSYREAFAALSVGPNAPQRGMLPVPSRFRPLASGKAGSNR